MISSSPNTAHDAPALARLAARIVWASLVVLVVSSLLALVPEVETGAELLALLALQAVLGLLLFLPYWRYVTWLRAVAVGRATDTDRVRVQRWAAALQWLMLVWLVYLIGSWLLDRLGLWRGELTVAEQSGGTLAFQVIGGVVTVGLLVQLRRWVDAHTHTQADAAARTSELPPLLPALTLWVRAAQVTLVLGLPLALAELKFAGTLLGVLDVLGTVLVPLLDILALEFSLRFARASAGTPQPQVATV